MNVNRRNLNYVDKSLKESFSRELIKESSDPILDIAEIGLDNIFDSKIISRRNEC